jgi:hypothetical protein
MDIGLINKIGNVEIRDAINTIQSKRNAVAEMAVFEKDYATFRQGIDKADSPFLLIRHYNDIIENNKKKLENGEKVELGDGEYVQQLVIGGRTYRVIRHADKTVSVSDEDGNAKNVKNEKEADVLVNKIGKGETLIKPATVKKSEAEKKPVEKKEEPVKVKEPVKEEESVKVEVPVQEEVFEKTAVKGDQIERFDKVVVKGDQIEAFEKNAVMGDQIQKEEKEKDRDEEKQDEVIAENKEVIPEENESDNDKKEEKKEVETENPVDDTQNDRNEKEEVNPEENKVEDKKEEKKEEDKTEDNTEVDSKGKTEEKNEELDEIFEGLKDEIEEDRQVETIEPALESHFTPEYIKKRLEGTREYFMTKCVKNTSAFKKAKNNPEFQKNSAQWINFFEKDGGGEYCEMACAINECIDLLAGPQDDKWEKDIKDAFGRLKESANKYRITHKSILRVFGISGHVTSVGDYRMDAAVRLLYDASVFEKMMADYINNGRKDINTISSSEKAAETERLNDVMTGRDKYVGALLGKKLDLSASQKQLILACASDEGFMARNGFTGFPKDKTQRALWSVIIDRLRKVMSGSITAEEIKNIREEDIKNNAIVADVKALLNDPSKAAALSAKPGAKQGNIDQQIMGMSSLKLNEDPSRNVSINTNTVAKKMQDLQ